MSFWNELNAIPNTYAQCPFWFWNDVLDADEYCRQIDEMAAQGVRQAMPHPRYGMDRRAYLSDEFFRVVKQVVDHAKEKGVDVILYDEFNWSSGNAGGTLTAERKNCALGVCVNKRRVKGPCEVVMDGWMDALEWCDMEDVIQVAYAPYVSDTEIRFDEQVVVGEYEFDGETLRLSVPAGDWMVFSIFTVRTLHPSPLREGNGGIVDYLNANVTRQFIERTHEKYYEHIGEHFGSTIPAIFYDEVGPYACGNFTWTDRFAGLFREIKQYDIMPYLSLLFFDGSSLQGKIRCDYWDAVAQIYTEGFIRQISSWCEAHGIALTGHGFEEARLWPHSADICRTLRAQTWVGVDSLLGYKSYCMLKTPISVAHTTGRKLVLAEAIGCLGGWAASPRMMRPAYNQMAIAGVNLLVPHAFFQSVDTPKAECPPSFFTNNPYWRYYHNIARMTDISCYVNRQGAHAADVVLYFPLESWWSLSRDGRGRAGHFGHGRSQEIDSRHESELYDSFMHGLMLHQLDYDVMDWQALTESTARDGMIFSHDESYRVLVLPPMTTIRLCALRSILSIARAGVPVVSPFPFAPQASMENGCGDGELRALLDELTPYIRVAGSAEALYDTIRSIIDCDVTVTSGNPDQLEAAHRKIENFDLYLLSNKSEKTERFTLRLRADAAHARLMDSCMNPVPAEFTFEDGHTQVCLETEGESLYYLALSMEPLPDCAPEASFRDAPPAADFSEGFTFLPLPETDMPYGVAPMQRVTVPVGRTRSLEDAAAEYLKPHWDNWMKPGYDDSEWEEVSLKRKPALFGEKHSRLFRFDIPAGARALHMPLPSNREYAVYVNGRLLTKCLGYPPETDCWLPIEGCEDRPGVLGVETASMHKDFGLLSGPEFLVAPFRTPLRPWKDFGMDWYSGFGLYEKTVRLSKLPKGPVWLDLGEVRECAEVRVNGKKAGELIWPPYRLNIAPYLEKGENRLQILVCNLISNEYAWDYVSESRLAGERLESGLIGPVGLSGL